MLQDENTSCLSGHNSASLSLNFTPFVPDYTVKASSDVIYLRIKRTTYLRALKATSMSKKPSPCDAELEKYLERVNEDENNPLLTPKVSPEKQNNILDHVPSFASGYVTPIISIKSSLDKLGGQSKHGGLNISFQNFSLDKDREITVEEEEDEKTDSLSVKLCQTDFIPPNTIPKLFKNCLEKGDA